MRLILHPLPVRIFHWTMFTCVMVLLTTGLYLHEPPDFLLLPLSQVRKVHYSFGIVITLNLLGQIYYYIYTAKFSEVLFLPRDIVNVPSFLRYYLFITAHHPNFGRYNPGQKFIFSAWGLAVAIGAITGFGLLFPNETTGLQRLLGGLEAMRLIQYGIAILFLATVPVHLYLVFTEDPAKLQAMFTGYINKEPKEESNVMKNREV